MKVLPVALAVLLLPVPAIADPCTGGYDGDYDNTSGASPSPSARTAVRMVAEAVDFAETPNDLSAFRAWAADGASWKVKAHYVFENSTNREIRTTMIFPWTMPDRYCAVATGPGTGPDLARQEKGMVRREIEAFGFLAHVDGAAVPATLDLDVTCAGGAAYPFGHKFAVTFPPGGTVNLDIEYTQSAEVAYGAGNGEDCVSYGVGFILRTGALWNGPIGELVLRYHFAYPTTWVRLRDDVAAVHDQIAPVGLLRSGSAIVAGVPFQVDVQCADNTSTLTLTARDVEPTLDVLLDVHSQYLRSCLLEWQGCPLDATTRRPARDCCVEVNGPLVEPSSTEVGGDPGIKPVFWTCYDDEPAVTPGEGAAHVPTAPGNGDADRTADGNTGRNADGGDAAAEAGGDAEVDGDVRDESTPPPADGPAVDAAASVHERDIQSPMTAPDTTKTAPVATSVAATDARTSTAAPVPQRRSGCGCVVAAPIERGIGVATLLLLVGLARRRRGNRSERRMMFHGPARPARPRAVVRRPPIVR
jgi:hypothetical protein